ncbi:uncharacterized protein AB9X84_017880 isoform 1-T2 [Acanthopagrus schlegelii]
MDRTRQETCRNVKRKTGDEKNHGKLMRSEKEGEEGEQEHTKKTEGERRDSSWKTAVMNAARIHDKQKLKSFWEQRIAQHCEQMDKENNRVRSSSLTRLKEQWLVRLDQRYQHQKSFFEERIRRAQMVQQSARKTDSP